MASVITRPSKTREIQLRLDHRRYTIRIGRVTAKQADTVRHHIEQLVGQYITGHPADNKTMQWLGSISDKLYDRIARVGLARPRSKHNVLAWADRCIAEKEKTAVAGTIRRLKQARAALAEHFNDRQDLRTVTRGDADDFETFLRSGKLAEATIRKRLADVRQWFGSAVKHRLIEENPFDSLKTTVPATEHLRFITPDMAERVMAEMPNARMRLVFALARWGGLRTPSEPAALLWSDIDWQRDRFTVRAPKTGTTRVVPLFPELRQPLQDVYDAAPAGVDAVFPGMSINGAALRNITTRAIKRAGLVVWPRLYHNLRSTRQTELEQRHPTHVVCAWMGNSQAVASRHYLQVTDDDYRTAVKTADTPSDNRSYRGIENPTNGTEKAESGV